jgi:hypothetical protein
MLTLHVELSDQAWVVRPEGASTPLSRHEDAGSASRAACSRARRLGDARVLVHDRYHRVVEHPPRFSRAAPGAR